MDELSLRLAGFGRLGVGGGRASGVGVAISSPFYTVEARWPSLVTFNMSFSA